MARDRQRAKRARQERSDAARAAGDGVDGAPLADDDDGLLDGTPAPDPLKGALPDVEQAKLAEAGASSEAEDIHYVPAPDAVEGDQPIRRSELDPSVAEESSDRLPAKSRPRFIAFLGHCVDELRRVQWPDRKQVFSATAVVLGFVVLAGGYLGLMDAIFKPLVKAIL